MQTTFCFPPFFSLCAPLKKEPHPIPSHPLTDVHNLETLVVVINQQKSSSTFWSKYHQEISELFSKYSKSESEGDIGKVIQDLLIKEIYENENLNEIEQFMDRLLDVLESSLIDSFQCPETKKNILSCFAVAKKRGKFEKQLVTPSIPSKIRESLQEFKIAALNFIPNLLNTVFSIFASLNLRKKFATLWDKYLVITIFAQCFQIPYLIVQLLQPIFIVATKVYLIAFSLIGVVGVSLGIYKKYIEPLPGDILHAVNLSREASLGKLPLVDDSSPLIDEIVQSLLVGRHTLLFGKSGAGKTPLTRALVQKHHKGELPLALQDKTFFALNCACLVHDPSHGHSELINEIRNQVRGFEDKIIFILDEVDELTSHPAAFQCFKKHILADKTAPLCIATTTVECYRKVIKIPDRDRSFIGRFKLIYVDGKCSAAILKPIQKKFRAQVPIQTSAIKKILAVITASDKDSIEGENRRAISLFEDAISICRLNLDPKFVFKELKEIENSIEEEGDSSEERLEKKEQLEADLQKWKQATGRLGKILRLQERFYSHYNYLGDKILRTGSEITGIAPRKSPAISLKEQKKFIFLDSCQVNLFKQAQEKVFSVLRSINPSIPFEVDEKLIETVYEKSK